MGGFFSSFLNTCKLPASRMNASSEPKQAPVELRGPEMDLDLDPLTEFTQNSGFLEYFQYRFDPLHSLGAEQEKR